ncbi:MAG TPA: prolyl oligopeptidase family serine peptidase [Ignavibacteria bacterium]|nr:prolyl oligopeptidase family serine peptidase [Ignavibacteria bacterium]HMR39791.1 prolyl oligopeptidase family serine peptidase [Ignavibacteria bacterium]
MIISEEEIILDEKKNRFIESGWGKEVRYDTTVNKIIYESDGLKINGYLAYPKVISSKLPLIIWNRGGYRKDGRIDEFIARGMFGEIASWGYVVLASQYREEEQFGGEDVNDVLNLIALSDEIEFCDPELTGMEGWSRGGMMTYKVLTLTDKIKCAVIISGLSDLNRSMENRPELKPVYEYYFGDDNETVFNTQMNERSAVNFAEKINKDTDILLIHGTDDNRVPHDDSEEMYKLLKKNGVHCELKLLSGGDHYLKSYRAETVKLRKDWFGKYLKK